MNFWRWYRQRRSRQILSKLGTGCSAVKTEFLFFEMWKQKEIIAMRCSLRKEIQRIFKIYIAYQHEVMSFFILFSLIQRKWLTRRFLSCVPFIGSFFSVSHLFYLSQQSKTAIKRSLSSIQLFGVVFFSRQFFSIEFSYEIPSTDSTDVEENERPTRQSSSFFKTMCNA